MPRLSFPHWIFVEGAVKKAVSIGHEQARKGEARALGLVCQAQFWAPPLTSVLQKELFGILGFCSFKKGEAWELM